MKWEIFEGATTKNRKNVPKIAIFLLSGGLRLQDWKLLRKFEGSKRG
jgi:hypothetical protein